MDPDARPDRHNVRMYGWLLGNDVIAPPANGSCATRARCIATLSRRSATLRFLSAREELYSSPDSSMMTKTFPRVTIPCVKRDSDICCLECETNFCDLKTENSHPRVSEDRRGSSRAEIDATFTVKFRRKSRDAVTLRCRSSRARIKSRHSPPSPSLFRY